MASDGDDPDGEDGDDININVYLVVTMALRVPREECIVAVTLSYKDAADWTTYPEHQQQHGRDFIIVRRPIIGRPTP
jgi:hypothetical protein